MGLRTGRGRRGVVVLAALVLVAVVLVVAVVLSLTRSTVLNGRSVEQGVEQVAGLDLKHVVSDVRCPDDQPVRAGASFTCLATVDGTPNRQVPVTVTDTAGNYDVGQPL